MANNWRHRLAFDEPYALCIHPFAEEVVRLLDDSREDDEDAIMAAIRDIPAMDEFKRKVEVCEPSPPSIKMYVC